MEYKLFLVVAFIVVFIGGGVTGKMISDLNEPIVTCDNPYIKIGSSCCLDKDQSGICDSDERGSNIVSDALKDCIRAEATEETYEYVAYSSCGHLLRNGCEFDFDALNYILAIKCN